MKPENDLRLLLDKYKGASMHDFVLARVAAKLDALELILLEGFHGHSEAQKHRACDDSDSACFEMTDAYLRLLLGIHDDGNGHDQSSAVS